MVHTFSLSGPIKAVETKVDEQSIRRFFFFLTRIDNEIREINKLSQACTFLSSEAPVSSFYFPKK